MRNSIQTGAAYKDQSVKCPETARMQFERLRVMLLGQFDIIRATLRVSDVRIALLVEMVVGVTENQFLQAMGGARIVLLSQVERAQFEPGFAVVQEGLQIVTEFADRFLPLPLSLQHRDPTLTKPLNTVGFIGANFDENSEASLTAFVSSRSISLS